MCANRLDLSVLSADIKSRTESYDVDNTNAPDRACRVAVQTYDDNMSSPPRPSFEHHRLTVSSLDSAIPGNARPTAASRAQNNRHLARAAPHVNPRELLEGERPQSSLQARLALSPIWTLHVKDMFGSRIATYFPSYACSSRNCCHSDNLHTAPPTTRVSRRPSACRRPGSVDNQRPAIGARGAAAPSDWTLPGPTHRGVG